uniref:Uncharacterized protein n=1 Tax=Lactuca sativa TaxID=4236 RepID=A0A9R1WDF8_LACSA|nr:hypothetical protein LSAT_V11C200052860 [Lactuca sativa]
MDKRKSNVTSCMPIDVGYRQQHIIYSDNSTYVTRFDENVNTNIAYGYQHTSFQSSSIVNSKCPLYNDPKVKRKQRKMYLDKRKCNDMTTMPIGIPYSI